MKAINKIVGSLVCAAAFVFVASQASANLIVNGGFEGGVDGLGHPNGWGVFNTSPPIADVTVSAPNSPFPPLGLVSADMNNTQPGLGMTLKQSTAGGSVVGAGVAMSLSFDVLLLNSANGGVFFYQIFNEQANGGVLAGSPGLFNPPLVQNQWVTITKNWVTTSPLTDFVTIQFDAITGANVNPPSLERVRIDNVNIIPEPSTVGLVGLGLLGLLGLVKRSRKS